jgi:DNA-binding MarR family transcriptional regulator
MFFLFLGAREAFDSPRLDRFALALETARSRYPGLTLSTLSTLFRIGTTPARAGQRVTVSDIAALSPGQTYPTVARQIDILCEGYGSVIGLGLVEKETDPNDRRNRYVAISERGKMLLHELDLILAPDLLECIGVRPDDKSI